MTKYISILSVNMTVLIDFKIFLLCLRGTLCNVFVFSYDIPINVLLE